MEPPLSGDYGFGDICKYQFGACSHKPLKYLSIIMRKFIYYVLVNVAYSLQLNYCTLISPSHYLRIFQPGIMVLGLMEGDH